MDYIILSNIANKYDLYLKPCQDNVFTRNNQFKIKETFLPLFLKCVLLCEPPF